jgi:hypothetical protein
MAAGSDEAEAAALVYAHPSSQNTVFATAQQNSMLSSIVRKHGQQ